MPLHSPLKHFYLRSSAFICGLICLLTITRAQELKVSLLTAGPGSDVYEVFGHNAIVFENAPVGNGLPVAYNWGVFDFHQPNFIGRFIMGRMEYACGANYLRTMVDDYAAQRRHVTLTPLNLSPTQAARLFDLCYINGQPGNRAYRYDYYRDNCSTRTRDMINRAVDGQLAAPLQATPTLHTFRWHTDRLSQTIPWLYVALHYVMGHPIDRPLTAWDECFLPGKLQEHLTGRSILWEDGSSHPLLAAPADAVPNTRGPEPTRPPTAWPLFLLAGLLWGGAIYGTARCGTAPQTGAPKRFRLPKIACLMLLLAWTGLCTLGGGISTWGWLFTDHVVARNNENWLQLSPLALPIMVGLLVIALNRRPRWITGMALITLGLSLLGLLLKVLPGITQPNISIILLALPLHVATLIALRRLTRTTT